MKKEKFFIFSLFIYIFHFDHVSRFFLAFSHLTQSARRTGMNAISNCLTCYEDAFLIAHCVFRGEGIRINYANNRFSNLSYSSRLQIKFSFSFATVSAKYSLSMNLISRCSSAELKTQILLATAHELEISIYRYNFLGK